MYIYSNTYASSGSVFLILVLFAAAGHSIPGRLGDITTGYESAILTSATGGVDDRELRLLLMLIGEEGGGVSTLL